MTRPATPWAAECLPRRPSSGQFFAGALADELALDFSEQGEQGGHDLGLEILKALETDVLLDGDEGDRCLGDRVEEADDFAEGPAEAGRFADDKAVTGFERAHELVETPAPGADILLAGGHAQVADGFQGTVGEIMVAVLNLTHPGTGSASRCVWHSWLAETTVCSWQPAKPCDLDVSRPRLIRDDSFRKHDWNEIAHRHRVPNRLGFAYQVAFVHVLGRFPHQEPEILKVHFKSNLARTLH